MKSRSLARIGRMLSLAAILSVAAPGPALADGVPPPDPLPFITDVRFSRSDCDTCPPRNCLEEGVRVTVSGSLPAGCYHFVGLHQLPLRIKYPVVEAAFLADTCGVPCPRLIAPFSGSIDLPPQPAGQQTLVLRAVVRSCPDSSVVDSAQSLIGFNVEPCPNPIPVDSLVRTFVKLAIVPEHPCAGDTVTLQLIKNGCPPCVRLVSFGNGAAGNFTFAGVIDWMPLCLDSRLTPFACIPETLSAPMGRLSQGSFGVSAPMAVRVLGTDNPDSTIRFRLPFEFQVGPPCSSPPPPCVARELQSVVPPGQCVVTLAPGTSGDVPLLYESELFMSGAQGRIDVPPPFRLTDLQLASHLTGVHLSWTAEARGARWLVFTDAGVTLAPGARMHLLNASVTADPTAPDGASGLLTAAITLAAGPDGGELPLCNRMTLDLAVVGARLCVAGEPSACDVNHDGRLDVRDLVRMVGCLGGGVDTIAAGVCVDCDSSGAFDLADIFCCARDILRGPLVPRDSVHADAAVSVSFDPVEADGSDLVVRVRVLGAHALGAALLRFDYPGNAWRASAHTPIVRREGPVAAWYPIVDVSEPGRIHIGGLRLAEAGSDEFTFELAMTPLVTTFRDPTSNGRLQTVGADLAARDGSVVTPVGALPSILLERGATPGGSAVELSSPRPNPFNGSTTFFVRLPASAPVDLAVHDLAGRRIATIAHAVYGAGEHGFSWNGAGAHDGLYFVRLTVNGQVLSTRVAMLRDSR
jgi:hypothetical protein